MDDACWPLIVELTDDTFGYESHKLSSSAYVRSTARCVVFHEGKIGVLFEDKAQCYLLPGGGIDNNESPYDACVREMLEELGCEVTNVKQVGVCIMRQSQKKRVLIEYVFTAEAVRVDLGQTLSEKEQLAGLSVRWMPLNEVLSLFKQATNIPYSGSFVNKRNMCILEYLS